MHERKKILKAETDNLLSISKVKMTQHLSTHYLRTNVMLHVLQNEMATTTNTSHV